MVLATLTVGLVLVVLGHSGVVLRLLSLGTSGLNGCGSTGLTGSYGFTSSVVLLSIGCGSLPLVGGIINLALFVLVGMGALAYYV